jgi:quercetin dioxygenase-like cupin family protein
MIVVDHERMGWDEWRPGVRSRAWATSANGATQIRIAEQILEPGNKAPVHWHYFEENITVIGGRGQFSVDGETVELGPAKTVIVPIMAVHGFESTGEEPLHVIAAMGWPIYDAYYVDDPNAVYRAGEILGSRQRRLLLPEAS